MKGLIRIFILMISIGRLFSYQGVYLEKSFVLDQTTEPLGKIHDMAVDEKEYIYIPDSSFSNLKVYDQDGRLVKVFGKKGEGPGEFLSPTKIAIHRDRICIQDLGGLRYIMFDRDFRELTRVFYFMSGHAFILDGDRIIANEFYRDDRGLGYKGIILDYHGEVLHTLISLKKKESDIWDTVTDSVGFVDASEKDNIYLAKSGRVLIFKFSKNGKLINSFGRQPSYFLPPKKTEDYETMIKWGPAPKGRLAGERWYNSFSWVSGLFVLRKHLGIVIRGPRSQKGKRDCDIQLYDLENKIIIDGIRLPEVGDSTSSGFVVKSDHIKTIYILEESPDDPVQCRFYKYKLEDLGT